jgi:uncharacterized protein YjaZ
MSKLLLLVFLFPLRLPAQQVVTTDLDHFWQALDSIRATKDTAVQRSYIHQMYIDPASEGLKAFMRNKEGMEKRWIDLINDDPVFWDSIRVKSSNLKLIIPGIEENIANYKLLYPALQPSKIFFLIGLRQQGGTIRNNLSIIGTEVLLSDPAFTAIDDWISLCMHEYTHTQQKRPDFQKMDVLTSTIREGACDFMAELVTKKVVKRPYMDYGIKHEAEVLSLFKKEMLTNKNDNWVSTGDNPDLPAPDLGYFVGYRICKSYYERHSNKQQAVVEILTLDFADPLKVQDFLKQSGIFNEKPGRRK